MARAHRECHCDPCFDEGYLEFGKRLKEAQSITSICFKQPTAKYVRDRLGDGERVRATRCAAHDTEHLIASRLAIKPEMFSRLLARLSKRGLISVDRQSIVVTDIESLREMLDFRTTWTTMHGRNPRSLTKC